MLAHHWRFEKFNPNLTTIFFICQLSSKHVDSIPLVYTILSLRDFTFINGLVIIKAKVLANNEKIIAAAIWKLSLDIEKYFFVLFADLFLSMNFNFATSAFISYITFKIFD